MRHASCCLQRWVTRVIETDQREGATMMRGPHARGHSMSPKSPQVQYPHLSPYPSLVGNLLPAHQRARLYGARDQSRLRQRVHLIHMNRPGSGGAAGIVRRTRGVCQVFVNAVSKTR